MKNLVVYFVDDILNIVYNSRVINIRLKCIIRHGNIFDKQKFMDEFIKILKKENIKGKLFGDSITIVKNAFYTNRDVYFLENVFMELGFLKISFLDVRDLLPSEDVTFIEVNNSYMVLYLDEGVFLDLKYFKDIPKILDYFSTIKANVILFGLNKNLPKIKLKNKEVYYYDNFQNYITESLLKVKKYGA